MHLKLNKNLLIFMPNYQSYSHVPEVSVFWDELAKKKKTQGYIERNL